jgi:hypothetical protein
MPPNGPPKRHCTVCALLRHENVPATHVAGVHARGSFREFLWFECDTHSPTDNHMGYTRDIYAPLADWFAAIDRLCTRVDVSDDEDEPHKSERPSGG